MCAFPDDIKAMPIPVPQKRLTVGSRSCLGSGRRAALFIPVALCKELRPIGPAHEDWRASLPQIPVSPPWRDRLTSRRCNVWRLFVFPNHPICYFAAVEKGNDERL